MEQKSWERATVGGQPHEHGFTLHAPATRLAFALARRGQPTSGGGGFRDLTLLKTTQSGYEGFLRDSLTALPETRERLLASSVTAHYTFAGVGDKSGPPPSDADAVFRRVASALQDEFLGPALGGVYSPSVQATAYNMCRKALQLCPEVSSITVRCPNIHFLPVLPAGIKFEDDLYVATSEPHGTIQATVARSARAQPFARL